MYILYSLLFRAPKLNKDPFKSLRRRVGAGGVLLGLIGGGAAAPHDPILTCRYSNNYFFVPASRIVTISNRSDDALVLKVYLEVLSGGGRSP